MAEKISVVDFELVEPTGLYKRALLRVQVGESVDGADTITLDDYELYVNEIISVSSHVFATGVPNTYAYATNVLTKTTAAATRDVIEILFK